MADKIYSDLKRLPKDVHDALARTHGMTSSETLRYLKSKKVKPVISLQNVQNIARAKGKLTNSPIVITKYLGKMKKGKLVDVEGTATVYNSGKKLIRIHPVVQYRTKKHVESLIDHEISHVKVYNKWAKYNKK